MIIVKLYKWFVNINRLVYQHKHVQFMDIADIRGKFKCLETIMHAPKSAGPASCLWGFYFVRKHWSLAWTRTIRHKGFNFSVEAIDIEILLLVIDVFW